MSAACSGFQCNDGAPTAGPGCATHHVDGATACADLAATQHLRIDLSEQVYFQRGIDRNKIINAAQHIDIVGVSDRPDRETESLPVFPIDATERIVDFMLKAVGLERS